MAKSNRDEFRERTKLQLSKRAGWFCSDPSCRAPTVGATSDGEGEINGGTAAHICAAAPGGPRYDPNMTRDERRSASNGIWLCKLHGSSVDSHDPKFTVELLRQWKAQAQKDSWRRVLYNDVPHGPVAVSESELATRLRTAAAADLEVFRRSEKWPSTSVALTVRVEGLGDLVSTSALASALATLDDLILVAPPGMGKTTTLFQVAEAVLASGTGSPIVIQLGEWSAEGTSLLESVLKRPAFRGISEHDLRTVAAKPGVILLLDGWNELDVAARRRAAAQLSRLQAELPELALLISTRKQALDVPIDGTRVDLHPLNETQQLKIARTLRGDAGARLVDQAWRTPGVRELVTIPLYLTALLTLPEAAPFPTTKEEILRRFIAAHEEEAQRAEVLQAVTHGLHERFLQALAETATRGMTTTLAEAVARRSVSETDDALVAEKQITHRPQPNTVLETLVSHHVLMRAGDPAGYSFQHQQFQEWYASHHVEHLMLAGVDNAASRDKLRVDVLNQPMWEEPILFACERLARGDEKQQAACGIAILTAFDVDPILTAEMIARSTDAVWSRVAAKIQQLVGQWHTPGKVDRALRFMITSGRQEFFDQVWPLITHANDQVNLSALRAGRRFRPSLLGRDAAKLIAALPPAIRRNVLHEIASNSGMDGLDLAATITKDDPDPEVRAIVVDAFAFRRADRHVADVLRGADEKTFDLVARKGLLDTHDDKDVKKGLDAARERQRKNGISTYDRLHRIVYAQSGDNLSGELTTIIAEMDIDGKDASINLIYEARSRYSRAIADGLLQRVRTGRTLFYGVDDLLASAGFSLEDDELVKIALSETRPRDDRAEAAASVLGPEGVARMIETLLDAKKQLRDASAKRDQAVNDRYHDLASRVGHTPGGSLIAAIRARSAQAGNEEIAALADLISRHPDGENDRGRPFDADALATIRSLAEDWGNRMLASGEEATRWQLASIATLASHAASVSLLPLLKRLLDENLRRYRAFREEAKPTGWRSGRATNEARQPNTHEFQRAFQAINAPETAALMREYLPDEHFGQLAALVLAGQWTAANEPSEGKLFRGGVDFSRVEERRAARVADPNATSTEADAIFAAIEPLIADGATEDQNKHAVALGIVAARLPHGQRGATLQKLLSLAPRRSRAALLQNLILSGESIDIEMVKSGLAEVFEAAKTQTWILSQDAYELKEWLRLLPFTSRPGEALGVLAGLPDDQRTPDRLEEMIAAFGTAPGHAAETVLFQVAEAYPKLYANRVWLDAILRRGTLSAARTFVDLVASGVFERKGADHWHMARQLAGLIREHPELRTHVYALLGTGVASLGGGARGQALLAQATAEAADADGLLLLVKIEMEHKPAFISWRTIESVVTEHVPSENWKGAYDVVPISAVELRRKLLAMTSDGGPTDAAARHLNQIDKIRDRYGIPESEPRHPDLASGKPWPIMTPDPEASETD